ncbi:GIY-YIG nuclease family protein [Candidatus Microgenomates bacterium]|nr:GIY-YIG nuclease family protein [Candidatus Microgenomates bacterium]
MSAKKLLSNLPASPGVYLFKNKAGEVLYVGKAINLKNRVSSYFAKNIISGKTAKLIREIHAVDFIKVTSELEALLLEAHLIHRDQPFFNSALKDDKHPLYIKITTYDEYPRIFMTRRENDGKSLYFGPFPESRTVRRVLKFLRRIFPYDTQNIIGKKACFWSHINLCNPCPSIVQQLRQPLQKQERGRYRKNIRRLVAILSRKSDKVKMDLQKEMDKLSKEEKFEEALGVRNQLRRIEYITGEYKNITGFLQNPNLAEEIYQQESVALTTFLESTFHFPHTISRIECFDASHTAMINPTVGMSTFINGESEKNFYRKFRIYGKVVDDLSFLEEALKRRFKHPEWGMPDLIVIDGGKQQVKRALQVINELGIKIPLVGLVKPFDNLVIPRQSELLTVKVSDIAALSLLQRVRDEAHRFAGAYHRILRSRNMLQSHHAS